MAKGRKKRKGRARRKFPPLAIMAGGIASIASMHKYYRKLVDENAWEPSDAFIIATTTFNPRADADTSGPNDGNSIMKRLFISYGGLFGGYLVHEAVGNAKGAFGTDLGIKVNRYMPAGWSI